ncbi:MAG: Cobalt/magnesium transport protein CorA [Verrucomicrobiae bacterium]|nr:Cobalt/magnesium transport protein CorA [Verrucomicrobiae bacterium]
MDLDSLRLVLYDKGLHVWVDMENPTDEEAKQVLETIFGFHPLAIEDCLTLSERPKADEYENYVFLVIHAVDYTRTEEFRTTELNIFLGKEFLVTFHREKLRSITATMERVAKNAPAVARAPDRLAHTILDFLFENYRPVLEELSGEIGDLEEQVLVKPSLDVLSEVLRVRKEVQQLRQIITPQREVVARFARGEFKLVRLHLLPYYRDLLDQLVRISDSADSYRDALTNVMQVHLNLQQTQVNQIIKVLTVLATLAMPIFIITSFYGMNFGHFPPEGSNPITAYLWVFGVTGVCTGILYLWLKRKGWL